MNYLIKLFNYINEAAGRMTAWVTTLLVLLICYDVAMRYIFGSTSIWIGELEWHLFALIFLLAAGYAFKHERHVRIDLFYSNWSPRSKAILNIFGTILFLIPWCLVIIYHSLGYAWISFEVGETSPDPAGLPGRYLIKFAIAFGFCLLLLQGVGFLLEQFRFLAYGKKKSQSVLNEDTLNRQP